MTKENKSKVYVGMSGGVDSSVSAALLKGRGFDVTGVFIKVWQPDWIECSWREDRLDAMRVCAKIGIPFKTLDLEKEYKEEVVDYMIREYKNGKTPNPDIMCNRYVKFGGFFDWAMSEGADFIATGHYVRIKKESEIYSLQTGRDSNKDQSYFLWTLRKEQLSKILFPVGDIEKPEVRELALKYDLPNAEKKDSQGLCFIGKIDIKEFLSHYMETKPGLALDADGNIVGEHDGAFFLTTGERRGFTITNASPHTKPYFIVDRDISKNTITVAHTQSHLEEDTKSHVRSGVKSNKNDAKEIIFSDENWITENPVPNKTYTARIRYRQEAFPCTIESGIARCKKPQGGASGQSIVFYDNDICMGGGIIS